MDPRSALGLALGIACLAGATWWLIRAAARSRSVARLDSDPDERIEATPAPPAARGGLAGALLVAAAVVVVAVAASAGYALPWPLGLALGLDAGAIVWLALRIRAQRRDLRLEEQVARAVLSVRASLRSGRSPAESLRIAAEGADAPFGPLLADAAGRLRLGEDVEQAFRGLRQAAPLDAVRLLVFALEVQWRAGGSLERSLDSVGSYVRDRVELQRRIESQSAPARSSVLALVGATVAVAFLAWSNDPGNVGRFVNSSTGEALVALALLLQGASLLWMYRLAQVRV